jgi:hypothetical protein
MYHANREKGGMPVPSRIRICSIPWPGRRVLLAWYENKPICWAEARVEVDLRPLFELFSFSLIRRSGLRTPLILLRLENKECGIQDVP